MTSDSDPNVRKLWQEQRIQTPRMSIDEIRAKAERFERKTRRSRILGAVLVIVLAIGVCVEIVWPGQDIVERTGDALTLAAFVYIFLEYRKYVRQRPDRLGLTNCVDFYRAQLTYEHNLARQSSRCLLPFVPGVTLSLLGGIVGPGIPLAQRLAVAVAGLALFLSVAWWNARSARRLQKEIDAI